jgi:hypothetical protein
MGLGWLLKVLSRRLTDTYRGWWAQCGGHRKRRKPKPHSAVVWAQVRAVLCQNPDTSASTRHQLLRRTACSLDGPVGVETEFKSTGIRVITSSDR